MRIKKKVVTLSFLGMTTILFLYVCYIGIKNILTYNAFKSECKIQAANYQQELILNRSYREKLNHIQDPDYWELQAKEQLGYIKKGEVIYKLKTKWGKSAQTSL